MRINRLELQAYGVHGNRTVEVAGKDAPLTLVVGLNEAGKSTLREAVADLIFGVGKFSPFKHDKTEMRIAAEMLLGDKLHRVHRYKRLKHALTDDADQPIADDWMGALTGALDRQGYERLYGLDRARMIEGGRAILDSKDDVAKLLFQAAAGIGDVSRLIDDLTQEADGLYGPRKKAGRAYHDALDRLQAAKAKLAQATARAGDYRKAQQALREISTELEAITATRAELDAKRRSIERIQRVAPLLQKWRLIDATIETLKDAVELPAGVLAQFEADVRILDGARQAAEDLGREASEIEDQLQGIAVNERVLKAGALIEAAAATANAVRSHRADLLKQKGRYEALIAEAAATARDLGWPAESPEIMRARAPKLASISELRGLIQEAATVGAEMVAADRVLAEAADENCDAGDDTDVDDSLALEGSDLLAAVEAAKALGDVPTRRKELVDLIDDAAHELTLARKALRLASPPDSLSALCAPEPEQVAQWHSNCIALRASIEQWERSATAASTSLTEAQSRERRASVGGPPVTSADVAAARDARDGQWQALLGSGLGGDIQQAYEAAVRLSDSKADERYARANDAHAVEAARTEADLLKRQCDGLAEQIDEAKRRIVDAERTFDEQMVKLGLAGVDMARYPDWHRKLAAALELETQVARHRSRQARFEEDIERARKGLSTAMAAAGLDGQGALEALLWRLSAAQRQAHIARERNSTLKEQRERAARALARAQQRKNDLEGRRRMWTERWERACASAGFGLGLEPQAVAVALDAVAILVRKLDDANALKTERLDTMEHDLSRFAEEVAGAATAAGWTGSGESPEAVLAALKSELDTAMSARSSRQALEVAREKIEQQRAQRQVEAWRAKQRVDEMLAATKSADAQSAREAIARADELRDARHASRLAAEAVVAAGDGRSFDSLRAEVDAVELDQLEIAWSQARDAVEELTEKREAALLKRQEIERQLQAVRGDEAAAEAEGERQSAIAEMSSAMERYVRVKVSSDLLDWALREYRERQDDPLLSGAGRLFSVLTDGAYEALAIDYSGDSPQLVAKRGELRRPVDAMSEGTRDQLFLALRLAAVELHLDAGGRPLPFVADDLFTNFDDERAAAGFRVLGSLAARTQVIYLTHHQHLESVARSALPSGLAVVHLERTT